MDPAHNVMHSKRQDVLLEAFERGQTQHGWEKWKLVLVGSIEPDPIHQQYVEQLKERYAHLPVEWRHDLPDQELQRLYQTSAIFWHAAGFGVDEQRQPQQVEHFGMSAVEAMSYGLIPVLIHKGGLKEIVTDSRNGFFFTTLDELVAATQKVMTLSDGQEQQLRSMAYHRAAVDFSLNRFCQTLTK